MIRRIFTFSIGYFLFISFVVAQTNRDSVQIANARWHTEKLSKGVFWKQVHFDSLYGSQQEVNVVEISLKSKSLRMGIDGLSDSLMLTSKFALRNHAIAAINGNFFDIKNGGSVNYIKVNGHVLNENKLVGKNGLIGERANGVLLINDRTIDLQMVKTNEALHEWDAYTNVLNCGPVLLMADTLVQLEKNPFNNNRHPRSAVALWADKIWLITVDGRNKHAAGMNLQELAHFLKINGASNAFNLDGGGSTALFVNTSKKRGIVNHPSDNKKFDHEGERKVANAIYLYRKK